MSSISLSHLSPTLSKSLLLVVPSFLIWSVSHLQHGLHQQTGLVDLVSCTEMQVASVTDLSSRATSFAWKWIKRLKACFFDEDRVCPIICSTLFWLLMWHFFDTGCSLNIVFFPKNFQYFATSPSPALGYYWL